MRRTPLKRTGQLRPRSKKRKRGRLYDEDRKAFISTLPCFICGAQPVHVAHIGAIRGLGQKCDDDQIAPLCPEHHLWEYPESHHRLGRTFWDYHGIDRDGVITDYQARYRAHLSLLSVSSDSM